MASGRGGRLWRIRCTTATVALVVLACALPAAIAADAHVPRPCRQADLLREAGLLREAASAYHGLAGDARRSPALRACVRHGLAEVALVRDRRARALADVASRTVGLSPRVVERLERAVRIAPSADAVARVMAAGIAAADGSLGVRIARALHLARYNAEANAVLRATVTRHPFVKLPSDLRGTTAAVAIDLAAARALSRAGFGAAADEEVRRALAADPTLRVPAELSEPDRRLAWWDGLLGVAGPWIRTLAELLAILLVALLLVVQIRRRLAANLSIESFTGGTDAFGPTTAASVRDNYLRITEQDGGTRPKIVDPSAQDFGDLSLPRGVTAAIPQSDFVNALFALLDRLVPTAGWQVAGELQPPNPSRGAGLRVTLRRRSGNVFREQTFWGRDCGPWPSSGRGGDATQEDYDRLAVPAAAWIVYETGTRGDPPVVLGTRKWRSYALFAVGADLQIAGRPHDARLRYQRALGIDPGNRGARLNLAVADTQAPPDRGAFVRARASLEALRDTVRDDDPMWYRVHYNLAVAWLRPDVDPSPEAAREAAEALCTHIAERLGDRSTDPALGPVLAEMHPPARLLLASALVEEEIAAAANQATGLAAVVSPPVGAGDSLADPPDEEVPDGLSHEAIVAQVWAARESLLPPAYYNLACYHVRLRRMGPAREALGIALERGDDALRLTAVDDPVLRPFCADDGRRRWLVQLLRRLGALPAG